MIRTGTLYLVGLFLIGALSAAAGINWLRQGEIVFRSSESSGDETDSDVVARIDRDDLLFVLIALAWFQLGSGVATLTILSLFLRERAVERWAGYACVGLIFLAVATALARYGATGDLRDETPRSHGQDPRVSDD